MGTTFIKWVPQINMKVLLGQFFPQNFTTGSPKRTPTSHLSTSRCPKFLRLVYRRSRNNTPPCAWPVGCTGLIRSGDQFLGCKMNCVHRQLKCKCTYKYQNIAILNTINNTKFIQTKGTLHINLLLGKRQPDFDPIAGDSPFPQNGESPSTL